jgi:multiple sugar transport system substrate-binding protein
MKYRLLILWGLVVLVAMTIISCHNLLIHPKTLVSTAVTIKLSGWGNSAIEQKLLRQVLNDFEAQHPKIKVKYEVISDQYMDVIKTRLVGESAPDVFYLDVLEAPFLMSQNVLEPLDNYITPEFDLADFEKTLLDSFKYQNHLYGLPKDYSTLALFYNKQAFRSAGLTSPITTWDELRDYSQKLTGRINKYGFGESINLARQVYKIKAFKGQVVDKNGYATFASAAALQGLQLVVDQYQKDHSSVQPSDVGTTSESEMFGQGKVAMVVDGNWAISYLQETFPKLDFATVELPSVNNKQGTMVFTVAYVMNKQTKHKNEAWELISYLTGKAGMERWTGTGFTLPTRKSVAQKLGYEKDILRSAFVMGVDYGIPWQVGKYSGAIVSNFDNQFVSALLGEQSLKSAMTRGENAANRQIQEMK